MVRLIARMVGIAVQRLALKDLTDLYQKTGNQEKLRAVRDSIQELKQQLDQIKKLASG